jgi:hypothetical protein
VQNYRRVRGRHRPKKGDPEPGIHQNRKKQRKKDHRIGPETVPKKSPGFFFEFCG